MNQGTFKSHYLLFMLGASTVVLIGHQSGDEQGAGQVEAAAAVVAWSPRCERFIPGVGQLVNGETDKAIGVFVVVGRDGAQRSSAGFR